VCSGCGRRYEEAANVSEREVRDLPCFQYHPTVVIELYRVRCPNCGLKTEKVDQLPSKAPFDAGVIAVPFGQLVPDAFLRGVVGGEGEGLQDFQSHQVGFVGGPEGGTGCKPPECVVCSIRLVNVKIAVEPRHHHVEREGLMIS